MTLGRDETKEKETLYYKIHNMDRRIIWWSLIILLVYILIRPLNIPISLSEPTKDAYDFITNLDSGDIVLFSQDDTTTVHLAIGESVIDIFRYFLENDIKIVILSLQQPGISTTVAVLDSIPNIDSYEYGVDYVHFGFYTGEESLTASLVSDVWGTLGADIHGTPISEIPLMENLRTAKDFDAWVESGGGGEYLYYLKTWTISEGISGIAIQTSANIGAMTTWWKNDKILPGFVGDQRGTVELTQLLGYPSTFVAMLDAQSVGHMFLIFLILVGNAVYLYDRFTRSEG